MQSNVVARLPDVTEGVQYKVLIHLLITQKGEEGEVGSQLISMLVTVRSQHVDCGLPKEKK
jgi:hypothetical protein